jgi:hypothetical protein
VRKVFDYSLHGLHEWRDDLRVVPILKHGRDRARPSKRRYREQTSFGPIIGRIAITSKLR